MSVTDTSALCTLSFIVLSVGTVWGQCLKPRALHLNLRKYNLRLMFLSRLILIRSARKLYDVGITYKGQSRIFRIVLNVRNTHNTGNEQVI